MPNAFCMLLDFLLLIKLNLLQVCEIHGNELFALIMLEVQVLKGETVQ